MENSEIYTKIVKINKTFLSRYGIINHSIKIRREMNDDGCGTQRHMNRCEIFSEGYEYIYILYSAENVISGKMVQF